MVDFKPVYGLVQEKDYSEFHIVEKAKWKSFYNLSQECMAVQRFIGKKKKDIVESHKWLCPEMTQH